MTLFSIIRFFQFYLCRQGNSFLIRVLSLQSVFYLYAAYENHLPPHLPRPRQRYPPRKPQTTAGVRRSDARTAAARREPYLELVHPKAHVELVRKHCENSQNLDGDTIVSPGSFKAATSAVGATIMAMERGDFA